MRIEIRFKLSEVGDLVDKLGVVDEGVAVVLPVEVDVVVTVHLNFRDNVVLVPGSHISFHSGCHVPLVVAGAFAALPLFPVGDREVEVGAS